MWHVKHALQENLETQRGRKRGRDGTISSKGDQEKRRKLLGNGLLEDTWMHFDHEQDSSVHEWVRWDLGAGWESHKHVTSWTSEYVLRIMCVRMQTVTGFGLPFPPSNSFFTESLGSGSVCGDDTLAAGGLALLWSRVWRMRQSSSCFSRSFQYSVSRERASQESVRASASAPKAVWENWEEICSHSGQYVCFHFIFWGSNPCLTYAGQVL